MSNCSVGTLECHWYAIRVLHQNEFKISNFIQEKLGLITSVPFRKILRTENGKHRILQRPILNSYVFVQMDIERFSFSDFRMVKGFQNIVKFDGLPASIPAGQIETLEKLGDSDIPYFEADYRNMRQGDEVEVVKGPLRGAFGNFISVNQRTGMFVVSLDIFRRILVVEIDSASVKHY